jgi:hypothetical protein
LSTHFLIKVFFINNSGSFIKSKVTLCEASNLKSDCQNEPNLAPLILIFLSQFVAGIGVVLFFTLGGPYLDDNTKRKNMPIVFGNFISFGHEHKYSFNKFI